MATVRITDSNKHQILQNASNMFSAESDKCILEITEKSDTLYDLVIPPEQRELMNALPTSYFNQMRYIHSFRIIDSASNTHAPMELMLSFKSDRSIPYCHNNHYGDNAKVGDLSTIPGLRELIGEAYVNYAENQIRRKTMDTHLRKIMDHNKTVGLCIKAWPQFLEVLTPQLREQHFAATVKTERTKAEFTAQELEDLNVSLMVGKLQGS